MSFFSRIKYYLFKHPLFRTLVLVGSIVLIFSIFLFILAQNKYPPVLTEITPSVGEPGDIMTITGMHFGTKETDYYVEIGGTRLTSSAYLSWSDTLIKVILPHNISDGLVYVQTRTGRSKPSIFANRQTIPVPVKYNSQTTMPAIETIKGSENTTGSIITIRGKNFGTLRGTGQVLFTATKEERANDSTLTPCSEFDKDYQFWSDTELQVRIPDGAISGEIYVKTKHGESNGYNFNLSRGVGTKTYTDSRTYLIKLNADISEAEAEAHATLTLFMPLPIQSIAQHPVEIISSQPEPDMIGYMNTLVHQVTPSEAVEKKIIFSHSLTLDVYAIRTSIDSRLVPQYSKTVLALYNQYLKADGLVPSDDESVIEIVSEIVGNEKNPWLKAKLLYDWIIENIAVLPALRDANPPILDVLTTNTGDAYDIAVLYTAFLRAAGIPAITNSGILVDSDMQSTNHWWCEFYIEEAGWIPVDPALGAGLPYKAFQKPENPADFYFGNLDAQHITFSRGWNNIGQTHITGKKVYRPKSYALQSIWEESTAGIIQYSSYWADAIVIGIYY